MTAKPDSLYHNRWPLARLLILILGGTFAGLMVDIRVEHVDAVREHSVAWLPIVYSGVMSIACSLAVIRWNTTTRHIMLVLFALAIAVGSLGFYFHNHGRFTDVIRTSLEVWIDPHMHFSDGPPQTAPLAFAGLGTIGILASLKRFDSLDGRSFSLTR